MDIDGFRIKEKRLIEELKSMEYNNYLLTEHWKYTRGRALSRSNNKCELCANTSSLHVHHKTYKNRGKELDEDLIVLCSDCHSRHHGYSDTKLEDFGAASSQPKGIHYIQGIMRNRMDEKGRYYDDKKSLKLLKLYSDEGLSLEELEEVTKGVKHWSEWRDYIEEKIDSKYPLVKTYTIGDKTFTEEVIDKFFLDFPHMNINDLAGVLIKRYNFRKDEFILEAITRNDKWVDEKWYRSTEYLIEQQQIKEEYERAKEEQKKKFLILEENGIYLLSSYILTSNIKNLEKNLRVYTGKGNGKNIYEIVLEENSIYCFGTQDEIMKRFRMTFRQFTKLYKDNEPVREMLSVNKLSNSDCLEVIERTLTMYNSL